MPTRLTEDYIPSGVAFESWLPEIASNSPKISKHGLRNMPHKCLGGFTGKTLSKRNYPVREVPLLEL